MEVQTTLQPKRSDSEKREAVTPSRTKKFLKATVLFLSGLILKPWVWRLLMVHIPEAIDKVSQVLSSICSFFTDSH